jgi:putative solute:sodium symporter small subunit
VVAPPKATENSTSQCGTLSESRVSSKLASAYYASWGKVANKHDSIKGVEGVAPQRSPNLEESHMETEKGERYWSATRALMFFMLFLWFVFSFGVHFFVRDLNAIVFLGFPLGFYMAAQGSLIAFVLMLFWFARAQDSVDRKYDVAED